MLFEDGFKTTYKGVECLTGILLLRPKGITDLRLRERMTRSTEEEFHQLLLHRRQSDTLTYLVEEMSVSLRISDSAIADYRLRLYGDRLSAIQTEHTP